MTYTIRPDDLSGAASRALVTRHLAGMHETSPPESVFALDIDKLTGDGVSFWTVWDGEHLAGMGAMKQLSPTSAEIKSMRAHDAYRNKGVGRAMLEYILGEARRRGYDTVLLETGTGPAFDAACGLYQRYGFVDCGPFADYPENPFSRFMVLKL